MSSHELEQAQKKLTEELAGIQKKLAEKEQATQRKKREDDLLDAVNALKRELALAGPPVTPLHGYHTYVLQSSDVCLAQYTVYDADTLDAYVFTWIHFCEHHSKTWNNPKPSVECIRKDLAKSATPPRVFHYKQPFPASVIPGKTDVGVSHVVVQMYGLDGRYHVFAFLPTGEWTPPTDWKKVTMLCHATLPCPSATKPPHTAVIPMSPVLPLFT